MNDCSAWHMLKLSLTATHCKLNLPGFSVQSACQTAFRMMSLPANQCELKIAWLLSEGACQTMSQIMNETMSSPANC